jgi:hypothetical protein
MRWTRAGAVRRYRAALPSLLAPGSQELGGNNLGLQMNWLFFGAASGAERALLPT